MSTAGGPKLAGIGRSGDSDIVLCLDTHDAASYPGEPVANAIWTTTGNIASSWATGDATWATDTVVNMKTPVGTKANEMWMSKSGNNGFYGSPNVCRLTSSGWTSDSTKPYYYALWITTDQWSQLDSSTYKYVTGSNGWPGFSATSYKCTVGGREWRYYKGYISAASNNSSGTEYFTFFKNGTWSEDLIFYTAGTMVHNNGNYAVPFQAGPGAGYARGTTDAWKDLSGHSNDGDFTNTTDTGVDNLRDENVIFPIENNYIDFDGTDDYVNMGDTATLGGLPGLTMQAWARPESGIADYDIIFNKENEYEMAWGGNGLKTAIYTNTSGWWWSSTASSFPTGQWSHVVATWNGTDIKQYINGELKTSQSQGGSYTNDANQPLYLGRRSSASPSYFWCGKLAVAQVYKIALSGAQIKANFNAQRSRFGV